MWEAFTSSTVEVPLALIVLAGLTLVVLVLVLWSHKRHSDPRMDVDCDDQLPDLLPSIAGLSHGSVIEGNAVEVLENGHFFDVLIEHILQARCSVHFETYLWKDGLLSERIVQALCDRARAGLQVRLMIDGNGGKRMRPETHQRLKDAGCRIAQYHDRRLRNIGVMNRRDHRKLVVLDGRTAFIGGHCVVDDWLGDAEDRHHFRDVSLRVTGPGVHALQSAFSENWVDETGELFVGNDVFPPLAPTGDVALHVARVKPENAAPAVKILHHLVMCIARKRLLIQNPYFLPDPEAVKALCKAATNGVDVRVMVPAIDASDMPFVQQAAHRHFETLLAGGVRLFEYPRTLLHQKLMVVDGQWCAIGSSNFDDRSFEINDEITVGLWSADLAARFEAIFERDARDCTQLRLEEWRRRGAWRKFKERAFYLFNEQL